MNYDAESLSNCFDTIVRTRRAVRKFNPDEYSPEAVSRSLERAHLAPSSSNMQLWEFYRVSSPDKMNCFPDFVWDRIQQRLLVK